MSRQIRFPSLIPLFDELTDDRVTVRPHHQSDFDELWEAIQESRDELRPWLPFADQSQEELRNWLAQTEAKWITREMLGMGIVERSTGRLVGNIGLMVRSWEIGSFEIGYWLRTSATGHGYMSNAVRLVADFAFDHLDAHRVMIRCDAENARSAAVPTRLGFTLEGRMRRDFSAPDGQIRDTLVFSMVREDPRWIAR
ncbi:MAG TPA: GNAT family N-acetyltransferase [Ktedonobacterales bacterium]|jgi:RimJ/RimL family protein N-acetyltransferase|nr:GNAT family N-acetyltransferase [Ktedonobacterales bacterium]